MRAVLHMVARRVQRVRVTRSLFSVTRTATSSRSTASIRVMVLILYIICDAYYSVGLSYARNELTRAKQRQIRIVLDRR